MRLRTRLLLLVLLPNLGLALGAGWLAWAWTGDALRHQAEERARAVGAVLGGGGFTANEAVLSRMRALTGYEFRLRDAGMPAAPGTVVVAAGGREQPQAAAGGGAEGAGAAGGLASGGTGGWVVEIDYRTPAYRAALRGVLLATVAATVAVSAVMALVAVLAARSIARPLEGLAAAASRLGGGDLDSPVAVVGAGEVAALAAAFDRMRVRLGELDRQHRQDERLATLGTFTATIAHEVRNPLSAVRLTVQMAARRQPGDAQLAGLIDEIDRLDLTVDELLAFAKGMSVTLAPCALAEVTAEVLRLLRRQAEHAGVALALEGDATVHADARRLRQFLLNLVLNAIQARRGEVRTSRVVVRIAADGLAVCDDGPGVDPALVARLFDPFASGRSGGTGLGLHLARAVAEAHGAQLAYEPDGPGARFVLRGLRPVAGG